ncbi:MAG: FIST N-terminal domain-containing protein [Thiolinea sp.]
MLKAVCAQTSLIVAHCAADALVCQADSQLGIYRPQAGILYSSHVQDAASIETLLQRLQQHFPGIQLIFCTVTSAFTFPAGYLHDGYFLCLLVSDVLTFRAGLLPGLAELQQSGSFTEAFTASLAAVDTPAKPGLCLAFPAYDRIDSSALVSEMQAALGADCLLFGGCSADYWPGEALRQNGMDTIPFTQMLHGISTRSELQVLPDAMPYLLVSGDFEYRLVHTCGWLDSGDRFDIEVDGTHPEAY